MLLSAGKLYAYNQISRLLPETRFFRLKVALLRWCGAQVGSNVRICSSAIFMGTGRIEIGDDTWVGSGVWVSSSSRISIGKCVDIAPHVFIGTGTHVIDPEGEHAAGVGTNQDVVVGDGAWLGVRSVILPGISVGRKAVVAAGSVVTKNVSERALVAGVPAVVKKTL